jgi:hypothetical protein
MYRNSNKSHSGFIKMFYSSRALEWINLRKLFLDLLVFFQFSHLCSSVEDLTFVWSYDHTIASVLYRPAAVFKQFSFVHLLHENEQCACMSTSRLRNFCDPLTATETSSFCNPSVHVRTMNMDIIQHRELRLAISLGLNHIPLQPTSIANAIAAVMHAFDQLVVILSLVQLQFPLADA